MKTIDLKNKQYFSLYGSDSLDEEGFRRLPIKSREIIGTVNPDVKWLATHAAGISAKFITDASLLRIKVQLDGKPDMSHMPATGQAGIDLYIYNEQEGQYVFHSVTTFDTTKDHYELDLFQTTDKKPRKMWLNLGLYMGFKSVEVSINKEAMIQSDPFKDDRRVLVYGTSITQGACSSRPGMLYTNLLSRNLDVEVLNMGFSGAALLEKEVAHEIGKLKNIDLLIIDVEANAGVDLRMKERLEDFLEIFDTYHPNTKTILVSRIPFAFDLYDTYRINMNKMYRSWLKKLVKDYQEKDKLFYYLDLKNVFGKNFTEFTVDGIHPTDLGAYKIYESYRRIIKKVF